MLPISTEATVWSGAALAYATSGCHSYTFHSAHCDTLFYCALEIFLLTYLLTYLLMWVTAWKWNVNLRGFSAGLLSATFSLCETEKWLFMHVLSPFPHYWPTLMFVFVAFSQTPAYAVLPWIWVQSISYCAYSPAFSGTHFAYHRGMARLS